MEAQVGTIKFSPQTREKFLEGDNGLPEDDQIWMLTVRELNRVPFGTVLFNAKGRSFKTGMSLLPPHASTNMSSVGVREDQINTDPR